MCAHRHVRRCLLMERDRKLDRTNKMEDRRIIRRTNTEKKEYHTECDKDRPKERQKHKKTDQMED